MSEQYMEWKKFKISCLYLLPTRVSYHTRQIFLDFIARTVPREKRQVMKPSITRLYSVLTKYSFRSVTWVLSVNLPHNCLSKWKVGDQKWFVPKIRILRSLPIDVSSVVFFEAHIELWSYHIWISKGKAIPLQAWTDPAVSKRLRLPDFKTVGTWRW